MNRIYQCQFNQLKLGARFGLNGNKCLKRSTRTADLLEYNRWFYVSQDTKCTTANLDDIDYAGLHGKEVAK